MLLRDAMDEPRYHPRDRSRVLERKRVVDARDDLDFRLGQQFHHPRGNLARHRGEPWWLCASLDAEDGLADPRGLARSEARLHDGAGFVTEEEGRLANRIFQGGTAETLLDGFAVPLPAYPAHEMIERSLQIACFERRERRTDEVRPIVACRHVEPATTGRGLQEREALHQLRAIRRQEQSDLAARRVAHPVDAIDSEVISERCRVLCVIGERQVPCGLHPAIPRSTGADHAKVTERGILSDEPEPVAENSSMDQEDGLTRSALGELDLPARHSKRLPRFRYVHRAPPVDSPPFLAASDRRDHALVLQHGL
jgi:hypothetical protein